MDKFFATTPIYYVNDVPHIGHTYTTVAADVITRFYKQKGFDARLLTGTDEHGAKIAEAAKKHGQQPQEYTDLISEKFKDTWKKINIDYARFIRTTDEDHIKVTQEFLQKMYNKGAIDTKPRLYTGLYCVGHEKFMSPEELVNGLCPDHKTKPIEYSEENYYFKLKQYEKTLKKLILSDEIKVRPNARKNEILGKLEKGLDDISISRTKLEWGIPLPFDAKHTAYVWIEALINYYTYGSQNKFWPADVHLVGKDILWFHAVIWPAMLLSIHVALPKQIFAHGFFTIAGQKMSKTIGNVIRPDELIQKYGVDGARYVLLAAFPFGEDGDFSWETFDRLYNADLANGLGNLVARIAKLCEKNNLSIKSAPQNALLTDPFLDKYFLDSEGKTQYKLNEALASIWEKIKQVDRETNEKTPWLLSGKAAKIELENLSRSVQQIAIYLQPFLPETSEKILKQFSGRITSTPPLFPRI